MARTARQDFRGALQHVMVRGIERRRIFLDDEDRHQFVSRLDLVVRETGTRCFAFAAMPNHFHLLLETGPTPLSLVMRCLGTAYAMDFNRRHERVGYVFQNRFLSKLVRNDGGLLAVVRYVHLNPVRAGLVADLDALAIHPWTGHAALMGRRRADFLDTEFVLSRLASETGTARAELVRWMALGLRPPDPDADPTADPGGAASPPPADDPPEVADPAASIEAWRRGMLERGWSAPRVVWAVCERFDVDPDALRGGDRSPPVSRAREAVAGLASGVLGHPHATVARASGVSRQAVEQALARFAQWDAAQRGQALRILGAAVPK
ncbi:MAG TPA: transposase [Planctomycetota bacterium]|nr:transposase [Planctomycetota bacterium]